MIEKRLADANRRQMLHVEGNRVFNACGEPVLLSGVNCASLEWDPHPAHLQETIRRALEDWKCNVIRLPLLPNGWFGFLDDQPHQDPDGEKYREFVDEIVNRIAAEGCYVILDLHGTTAGTLGTPDYGPMPDMTALSFWNELGKRYKNHPNVLFGLFNEPRDISWEVWKNGGIITSGCQVGEEYHENTFETPGMKKILETVRAVGAENIAVIGGNDWSFTWKGAREYLFPDEGGNGIILDTHIYPWKSFDWDGHIGCVADLFPILVGECGHSGEHRRPENPQKETSNLWVPRLLRWIADRGFHVTAWDFHHEASPCLIEDLEEYRPTPFWGRPYKDFLAWRAADPENSQVEIEVNAKENSVRFFGRCEKNLLSDGVFFNWSGSGFMFRFTGTRVEAELLTDMREGKIAEKESRAYIGVYVDNTAEPVSLFPLDTEKRWYPLAGRLPYGEHLVKVVKLTEAGYARAAVTRLRAFGTMQPVPAEEKTRKLEIIGDSISCGYGNVCTSEAPDFMTREENSEKTFGRLLASWFGAEANIIAASGNGFYHDYGCSQINLIPELYPYTDKMLADHYGSVPEQWDFGQFKPAVILLKLGNNDARYCDGWDKEREEERAEELKAERRAGFIKACTDFLREIRRFNPESELLVIYENSTILKKEIVQAAELVCREDGDGRIHLKEIETKRPEEGVGANGHWSACTHQRVCMELIPVIQKLTGWGKTE